MSMTTSAARTAVRAANTAGKQATVTYSNDPTQTTGPATATGTARWSEPADPNCRSLLLFGCTLPTAMATTDSNGIDVPSGINFWSDPRPHPRPWTTGAAAGSGTRQATVLVRLDDIDGIATAGTSADVTLGTRVNEYNFRQVDGDWRYGTGLE